MTHAILSSLLPHMHYIFETEAGRTDPMAVNAFSQALNDSSPELVAVYGATKQPSNVWSKQYGWNPSELHRTVNTVLQLVTLSESAVTNSRALEQAIMRDASPIEMINDILAKHGVKLLDTQHGYLEFGINELGSVSRVKLMPKGHAAEILSIYYADSSKGSCDWKTDLKTSLDLFLQQTVGSDDEERDRQIDALYKKVRHVNTKEWLTQSDLKASEIKNLADKHGDTRNALFCATDKFTPREALNYSTTFLLANAYVLEEVKTPKYTTELTPGELLALCNVQSEVIANALLVSLRGTKTEKKLAATFPTRSLRHHSYPGAVKKLEDMVKPYLKELQNAA